MKNITPLIIIISIAAMLAAGCTGNESMSNLGPAPLNDPDLRNAVDADDKVVVALFLYPGGYPCQQQASYLDKLQGKYGDKLVVLQYAVNDQSSHQAMSDFIIETVPTTVIIDDNGYIIQKYTGVTDDAILDKTISKLVLGTFLFFIV